MSVTEVEKLALNLAEQERAALAANLLHSLPPILYEADEGAEEALRRDTELSAGLARPISLSHLDAYIERLGD